jgi:hypothetical protein
MDSSRTLYDSLSMAAASHPSASDVPSLTTRLTAPRIAASGRPPKKMKNVEAMFRMKE